VIKLILLLQRSGGAAARLPDGREMTHQTCVSTYSSARHSAEPVEAASEMLGWCIYLPCRLSGDRLTHS